MSEKYNEYKGIPWDFIPDRNDLSGLTDIVIDVKEAIRVRHDFNTALDIANQGKERRLRPVVAMWESNFAKSARPGAQSLAGLAAEHKRLKAEAQQYANQLHGNGKLDRLVRENIHFLFPDIGYNASTGEAIERLRPPRTVLSMFHPLGVEDAANLIRLMVQPPWNYQFYW